MITFLSYILVHNSPRPNSGYVFGVVVCAYDILLCARVRTIWALCNVFHYPPYPAFTFVNISSSSPRLFKLSFVHPTPVLVRLNVF